MDNIIYPSGYKYFTDENGKLQAVSEKTGIISEAVMTAMPIGTSLITPDHQEERRKYFDRQKENVMRRTANKELGNFFYTAFNEEFPGLTPQTVARLIYLNTFADYNTNQLVRITSKGKIPICKKDLCKILNLSSSAVKAFWREVVPKYLNESVEGFLNTDTNLFIKRKLNHKGKYRQLQKFYIKGVQNLYESTEASRHKHLGYIFCLLPYINLEYNILCTDPLEDDLEKITPLSIGDFCSIIGYDKSHLNRLLEIYGGLTFNVNSHSERFCSFVYSHDNSSMKIFINPHIFYNGTDFKKVEVLGVFCK